MSFSPLIRQLIDAFRVLPGVGQKTAQRMALQLLERDRSGGQRLADALTQAMQGVGYCRSCPVKMIRTHSIHAQVYKKGAEILSVLYIGINAFRKFSPVHSAMFCTAVHSEDLMFNNICFYDYINRVSFFGWHTDCSLAFLEQGTFFASGRIMGNCPVNFLWD